MAAKKPVKQLKLTIMGGAANPAPPIGPALGQAKVNIGEFVQRFNADTANRKGEQVPVIIRTFEDKTFTLEYKQPPVTGLILKAINKQKGAGKAGTEKAGTLSRAKLKEIAEKKLPDLNAGSVEAAMNIVEGSARSMGVDVK